MHKLYVKKKVLPLFKLDSNKFLYMYIYMVSKCIRIYGFWYPKGILEIPRDNCT